MNPISAAVLLVIACSFILVYLKKSYISLTIIIANFVIFGIMYLCAVLGYFSIVDGAIMELGCKPSDILSMRAYTVFTHMFIHGSILHIVMNMLFLLLIGSSFEERIGTAKFTVIYFLSGILGVVFNAVVFYLSSAVVHDSIGIGASGAIFGIVCAYAFLYPRDEVSAPLVMIWFHRIPVIIVAAVYIGIETVYAYTYPADSIGHIVHLGGGAAGIFTALLLTKIPHLEIKKKKQDFALLEQLAKDSKTKEILAKIKSEDIPEIRDVWIEEFFKCAKCPKCNSKFIIKERYSKCKCEKCGFEVRF